MSLADHFEPIADPAFFQTVKPEDARWQLKLGIGFVAAATAAAAIFGATVGFDNVRVAAAEKPAAHVLVVQQPQLVHSRHASEAIKALPGG